MGTNMEKTSSVRNKKNSIDRLPDELLISIVSLLSVKEAVRTSILARRWQYFWVFNPNLDFDGLKSVCKLRARRDLLETERIRFVGWVNKVLNLHLNETIDEFRVFFDLDNTNADDINRWIEFAFRKRVKTLVLSMPQTHCSPFEECRRYALPNIYDPSECSRVFPLGQPNWEPLVSLRLAEVGVTSEVVEYFISSCPFLEELRVENADGFGSLRTSCQAIRLRHLAIINCKQFSCLEICSPNLVSCKCIGRDFTVAMEDVASLVSLSLGQILLWEVSYSFLDYSGCFSRLETLTLQTSTMPGDEELEFPDLPLLKKLVLEVNRYDGGSLLCFTPLLNAAPLLHEMVVRLAWSSQLVQKRAQRPDKGQEHRSLRVFEIAGIASIAARLEVALYVLANAPALEKMIINEKVISERVLALLKAKVGSESCVRDITDITESMFLWY